MRMTPALRTLFERYRRRAGKLATPDFLKLIKDAADKQTRWTAVAGSQDLADFIDMLRCSVRGEYHASQERRSASWRAPCSISWRRWTYCQISYLPLALSMISP